MMSIKDMGSRMLSFRPMFNWHLWRSEITMRLLLTAFWVLSAGALHAGDALDIVVYGATGDVGSLVVEEALDRGHSERRLRRN